MTAAGQAQRAILIRPTVAAAATHWYVCEADYKSLGEAKVTITITTATRTAKIGNFIRFQWQYLDVETGFHYNRYHYYDPAVGRYVSKDPIWLVGGVN